MSDDPRNDPSWSPAGDPAPPGPEGAGPDPRSGPRPPTPEQSWRGLAVGLAIGTAVLLLVLAVVVAMRSGDEDEATTPTTTAATGTSATTVTQPAATTPGQPSETGGAPTTRKPTPLSIVATDDRRVVVLDQSGSAAPRVLFDLGPSQTTDQDPPFIGGVSLSGDGTSAFFDVAGRPPQGVMNRVPVAGGPAQELGPGVAPAPSPDGSMLALVRSASPDDLPTVVLRSMNGGNERRIELGEAACGTIAWSPSRREVAVDLCSGEEPVTVAIVDVATAGVQTLTPPDGTTWSVPAYKPDGTLTLVEQRVRDAAVVALNPDRNAVASTILRRPSTTISTIDWSSAGDLVVCDADGIILAAIGGTQPQQVATGYTAAAW